MGTHLRLGEESAINTLPEDVLRIIGACFVKICKTPLEWSCECDEGCECIFINNDFNFDVDEKLEAEKAEAEAEEWFRGDDLESILNLN
jgi:hypothetical protein